MIPLVEISTYIDLSIVSIEHTQFTNYCMVINFLYRVQYFPDDNLVPKSKNLSV